PVAIGGRPEQPELGGLDGLLVQPVGLVERLDDPDVANGAVLEHDGFEFHEPLNLGSHRLTRVAGAWCTQRHRIGDTGAGAIGPERKAGSAAGIDATAASAANASAGASSAVGR